MSVQKSKLSEMSIRDLFGFEQPSPDDPSFGKPFAWPYPSDTADQGERVSPLDHSGDQNDSPRAQDT